MLLIEVHRAFIQRPYYELFRRTFSGIEYRIVSAANGWFILPPVHVPEDHLHEDLLLAHILTAAARLQIFEFALWARRRGLVVYTKPQVKRSQRRRRK
jgi:hypothetical protein